MMVSDDFCSFITRVCALVFDMAIEFLCCSEIYDPVIALLQSPRSFIHFSSPVSQVVGTMPEQG